MSSSIDGGLHDHQLYFCHQCNRTVSTSPTGDDLLCPICNGGFLEELDPSPPQPLPPQNPFFSFSSADVSGGRNPFLFSSASVGGGAGPQFFSRLPSEMFGVAPGVQFSSGSAASPFLQQPDEFNPFAFLQNYIQTLSEGGANIQFVIDNSNSLSDPSGGLRLPANLGDYLIGPGLEQLIQQLAENDPNRYGTPPATKSAVEGLPQIKVSEELLASDFSQCAVCMDTFQLGEEVKQMPCKHLYHTDCLLPWLELHNSCPVCRYELPTDDTDYEQRARGGVSSANGAGATGGGNVGGGSGAVEVAADGVTPRTVERRLRISLPWPFRGIGSMSEMSNNENDNNNNGGNTTRESNTGNGGNPNFSSETRQEDLD